jgi:uncharacterized protein YjbJ (UPF0337 family)
MNWDQIEGKWSQIRGEIRQKWGKLTDNDLEIVADSKDKFVGRIQDRYGIAKEEAQQQLDEWLKTIGPGEPRSRRRVKQIPVEQLNPEAGTVGDER